MALVVASRDWDHDHWVGPFYPDDLPPEWRLGYYANQFRGVLVPAHRFSRADVATIAAWADEVPAGFFFWVELPPASLTDLAPGLSALSDRLAGVVIPPAAAEPGPAWFSTLDRRVGRDVVCALPSHWSDVPGARTARPPRLCRVWEGAGPGASPCCVWMPPELPSTTRRLGDDLRGFVAAAAGRPRGLVCFPPLARAPATMEEAQIILDLLGA